MTERAAVLVVLSIGALFGCAGGSPPSSGPPGGSQPGGGAQGQAPSFVTRLRVTGMSASKGGAT